MLGRRLARELLAIVAVKLPLLGLLWFLFIRDARVDVDAPQVAQALTGTPARASHGDPAHAQ